MIQGPGLVGSPAALPPATDGSSASLLVLMLSEGGLAGPAAPGRPWPANTQTSFVASKREAKISLWPKGLVLSSYQVAHGTARPAPAKSIAGASPSRVWSKLSEAANFGLALERPPTVPWPLVTQAVPLNAREKTCW